MLDEIRFYRASEKPYGAFSNLYRRGVEFEGEVFVTSEHAYQAGKARKPTVREVADGGTVSSAARHGRPRPLLLGCRSGLVDIEVRPHAWRAAGEVHPARGSAGAAPVDWRCAAGGGRDQSDNKVNRLWGEVNGVGRNMLGVLLMELRDALRAKDGGAETYLVAAE